MKVHKSKEKNYVNSSFVSDDANEIVNLDEFILECWDVAREDIVAIVWEPKMGSNTMRLTAHFLNEVPFGFFEPLPNELLTRYILSSILEPEHEVNLMYNLLHYAQSASKYVCLVPNHATSQYQIMLGIADLSFYCRDENNA